MAMQPLDRPAGSVQRLRYRGTVSLKTAAGTYPKDNATAASDSTIDGGGTFFTAWVRFALFDSTDLTDTQKRLLAHVYDDEQPSEDAPHASSACVASSTAGINTSDRSINTRTWAQNLQIHYDQIDANVQLADVGVSVDNDPANGAMVLLDTGASSGLGGNTGLPVVAVRFQVATTGQGARQAFSVDIEFEITHSSER